MVFPGVDCTTGLDAINNWHSKQDPIAKTVFGCQVDQFTIHFKGSHITSDKYLPVSNLTYTLTLNDMKPGSQKTVRDVKS